MTFTTSDDDSPAAVRKGSTWVQSHSSYSCDYTATPPTLGQLFHWAEDFVTFKMYPQPKVACQYKSCIKLQTTKHPNTRKKRALKFKVCRKIFQIEFSLCNKLWLYHCFTLMAAPKFHKCPSQPPTDAISVGPRNAGCGVLAAWASWQLSRV